jgi:hypothetical protein
VPMQRVEFRRKLHMASGCGAAYMSLYEFSSALSDDSDDQAHS